MTADTSPRRPLTLEIAHTYFVSSIRQEPSQTLIYTSNNNIHVFENSKLPVWGSFNKHVLLLNLYLNFVFVDFVYFVYFEYVEGYRA